jgi:hypothetical protein
MRKVEIGAGTKVLLIKFCGGHFLFTTFELKVFALLITIFHCLIIEIAQIKTHIYNDFGADASRRRI